MQREKLKITVGQITRIGQAFKMYVRGVTFKSPEVETAALMAYIEAYARKVAENPDTFLDVPALKKEDVIYGIDTPKLLIAYYKANSAVLKIREAYEEAEAALIGIGSTPEAASQRLKEISAAIWNAERVRESAYGELDKVGIRFWNDKEILLLTKEV